MICLSEYPFSNLVALLEIVVRILILCPLEVVFAKLFKDFSNWQRLMSNTFPFNIKGLL